MKIHYENITIKYGIDKGKFEAEKKRQESIERRHRQSKRHFERMCRNIGKHLIRNKNENGGK